MLLGINFSWGLFLGDVVIYVTIQLFRIWLDIYLPKSWFNPELPLYQSRRWEKDGMFYERYLHISKWKDKLPAVNSLDHFSKKKLKEVSPKYIRLFIFETCRGESNHIRTIISTVLFAIWNPWELFTVIFSLSFLGNLPFIFIQRYNRPRLKRLLARLEAKSLREGLQTSKR